MLGTLGLRKQQATVAQVRLVASQVLLPRPGAPAGPVRNAGSVFVVEAFCQVAPGSGRGRPQPEAARPGLNWWHGHRLISQLPRTPQRMAVPSVEEPKRPSLKS